MEDPSTLNLRLLAVVHAAVLDPVAGVDLEALEQLHLANAKEVLRWATGQERVRYTGTSGARISRWRTFPAPEDDCLHLAHLVFMRANRTRCAGTSQRAPLVQRGRDTCAQRLPCSEACSADHQKMALLRPLARSYAQTAPPALGHSIAMALPLPQPLI